MLPRAVLWPGDAAVVFEPPRNKYARDFASIACNLAFEASRCMSAMDPIRDCFVISYVELEEPMSFIGSCTVAWSSSFHPARLFFLFFFVKSSRNRGYNLTGELGSTLSAASYSIAMAALGEFLMI